MELWFTEKQTPNLGITLKLKETFCREQTEYQDMMIVDTCQFGRMLCLDGTVQTTEGDEFVYHEMICHVPLFAHPNPKKVLVIGGGDGGAIREALKHPSVEKVVLAEIDGRVVEQSRKYLPSISCELDNPRAEVFIGDGIEFVKNSKNEYDVILVDSTDPVGPAVGLFAKEFYQSVYEALTDDGILVPQTESPFLHQDLICDVQRSLRSIFPTVKTYMAGIPTYPSGTWTFTAASKKHDPETPARQLAFETKYYTTKLHKGSFALPASLERRLEAL